MGFDLLINQFIECVQRKGTTVYRELNHFLMYRNMQYNGQNLVAEVRVASVPGTDGWCWIRVFKSNICVLNAEGNYQVGHAFNMEAKEYAPGLWEDELK